VPGVKSRRGGSNGRRSRPGEVRTLLDHLERRRNSLDQSTWQAPGLTIAAQAFLLNVLTNAAVDSFARAVILVAGVGAVLAAAASLLRLRYREVLYSEVVGRYAERARILDPRAHQIPITERKILDADTRLARVDRWLRGLAGSNRWPPMHLVWVLALFLFAVADVVAFFATD
jgi:hypothetical protein